MSRATDLLGEQRYTGGDEEREERFSRWRSGLLHRIAADGSSLHAQSVEWHEWPRARARFAYRPIGSVVRLTGAVSTVLGEIRGGFEFAVGRVRYRLEEGPTR